MKSQLIDEGVSTGGIRGPMDPVHMERLDLVKQGLKRCDTCHEIKPLIEFYPVRSGHGYHIGGVTNMCRLRSREEALRRFRERLYGISMEEYLKIFAAQNSACAICGRPGMSPDTLIRSGRGASTVDHDHTTGEIRGLLCNGCNHGLGAFNDSPNLLQRAAAYLLLHSTT